MGKIMTSPTVIYIILLTLLGDCLAQIPFNQQNPDYNSRDNQNARYNPQDSSQYNQQNTRQYDQQQNNRQYDQENNRQYDQQNNNNNNRQNDQQNSSNNNRQYDQQNNRQYDQQNNRQYDQQNNNNNNRQNDQQNSSNNNRQYDQQNNRQYDQQNNRQYDQQKNNPLNSQQYQPQNNRQYEYNTNTHQYTQNERQYSPSNEQEDCCQEYCYSTDENPNLYYGSKTGYQIVYGKRSNQHIVPECTPIQFWSINRHGVRLPTFNEVRRLRGLTKVQQDIVANYVERRSYPYKGGYCQQDMDLLRKWKWPSNITEGNVNVLTSQGIEDIKFLATRYRTRFAKLLPKSFNDQYYNFQYDMNSDRIHDSYQAFIEGLFEREAYKVHSNIRSNEKLLPDNNCKVWKEQVEENNYTYREYENFKAKDDYRLMLREIFKRLGYRYTLNESLVRDMYDMCRYEKAWNINEPSAWCTVFNKDQLKLIEYGEDLADYYYSGYGNEINEKVGCLLVKDWYRKFENTVNGSPEMEKVSVYFTHSTEFQRFLTAMGIAKDRNKLTADNFREQSGRKWKVSAIDPFGANLAAVLYECKRDEKYRVMLLLNELPVDFQDCSYGLCNWSTIQNKFKNLVDNCNSEYCESGRGTSIKAHMVYLAIIISLVYQYFQ